MHAIRDRLLTAGDGLVASLFGVTQVMTSQECWLGLKKWQEHVKRY